MATAPRTQARCCGRRPGTGRLARMPTIRNGWPVTSDSVSAERRICPPPSPSAPSRSSGFFRSAPAPAIELTWNRRTLSAFVASAPERRFSCLAVHLVTLGLLLLNLAQVGLSCRIELGGELYSGGIEQPGELRPKQLGLLRH